MMFLKLLGLSHVPIIPLIIMVILLAIALYLFISIFRENKKPTIK